jgi:hypothetical protein
VSREHAQQDVMDGEHTHVAEHGAGSSWTSPAMDGREVRSQQVLG